MKLIIIKALLTPLINSDIFFYSINKSKQKKREIYYNKTNGLSFDNFWDFVIFSTKIQLHRTTLIYKKRGYVVRICP